MRKGSERNFFDTKGELRSVQLKLQPHDDGKLFGHASKLNVSISAAPRAGLSVQLTALQRQEGRRNSAARPELTSLFVHQMTQARIESSKAKDLSLKQRLGKDKSRREISGSAKLGSRPLTHDYRSRSATNCRGMCIGMRRRMSLFS